MTVFLNMSNGLALLPQWPDARFVRIQSTACEQKLWGAILDDLDYTFLAHVAAGDECVVVDTSNRKCQPRAIYQGVPWIRYALEMTWLGEAAQPHVKGCNVLGYFAKCYAGLPRATLRRLDYVASVCGIPTVVNISGICANDMLDVKVDGRKDMFVKTVTKWAEEMLACTSR